MLEDRRMLAELIGVDFDGPAPTNWTPADTFNTTINFFNLKDEAGVFGDVDFELTTNVGPADHDILPGSPIDASTVPMHSTSLTELAGFAFAENHPSPTLTATWSDLDPALTYEVYVFGFDGEGFSNSQTVTITGGGLPIVFNQSPSSNNLWVNGQLGSSSQLLADLAVFAEPNATGEIVVTTQATFGSAVLGGLAIREVGIVVNSTADDTTPGDGLTTLREAIERANTHPGAHTIKFDSSLFSTPQSIAIGSQLPTISEDLKIEGPGADQLTIDAGDGADNAFGTGDGYRIFDISLNVNVAMSGLTLTGGDISGSGASGAGGAISNLGNLSLTESTISGNSASHNGGGIYDIGTATIAGSTVSGNRAGRHGGGIHSGSLYATTVVNSTISGNEATQRGGGINNYGILDLSSSTVTSNTSDRGGGIDTGYFGTVNVTGSIIAGNTATTDANVRGTLNTNTFNILSGNPLLGPLANNGGSTQTHALLFGSPAIDAGDPSILPNPSEFDQRGAPFVRVFNSPFAIGSAIDIGAYELQTLAGGSFTVDTTADENDGDYSAGDLSLREAIRLANGSVNETDFEFIFFSASVFSTPQTIFLESPLPTITEEVVIRGPGKDLLTLDAQQNGRIFQIDNPNASLYRVEITDFTLTGAEGGSGAAIYSRENTTLKRLNIVGNTATGTGLGGAINHASGTMTIYQSTISGNVAGAGGGIFNSGTLDISDSTIAENTANVPAYPGGGIFNQGTLTITNSTISGNRAGVSSAGGGGIFNRYSGNVTVTNSTITGNEGGGITSYGGSAVEALHSTVVARNTNSMGLPLDLSGTIELGTFTLVGDAATAGGLTATDGNLLGADPRLGPLANNGGPTKTHALLPGSPALDAVGLLDDYSSNNFATNYNFVNLFGNADNNPQVAGGQANLNVSAGTGAFIWNRGERLTALSDQVGISFGFNYPINSGGFFHASAGLALFDSVTGGNLVAEIRVETDETDGTSVLRLNDGTMTTNLSGQPTGLMNLEVEVGTTSGGQILQLDYKLSGDGFSTIINTINTPLLSDIFFGPVAFDVSGTESMHDNLAFISGSTVPFDQRGLSRIANGGNGNLQDIGAYEAQVAPSADYVDDDLISGLDFLAWQRGAGTSSGATRANGDSDGDGDVDSSDLAAWEATYGQADATPLVAAVSSTLPEKAATISEPLLVVETTAEMSASEHLAVSVADTANNVSKSGLLDAARAWRYRHSHVPKAHVAHVREAVFAELLADAPSHRDWYPLTPSSTFEEIGRSESDRFEGNADVPWLADELLEKVFG
ncbi:MAG: right-handed parallel beta-helix repeat-containing protein [Planctomycetales bacterium]|nr:right-handed parallel beta-helix repeat-containing protein [Planctomycetales bacterium]